MSDLTRVNVYVRHRDALHQLLSLPLACSTIRRLALMVLEKMLALERKELHIRKVK